LPICSVNSQGCHLLSSAKERQILRLLAQDDKGMEEVTLKSSK